MPMNTLLSTFQLAIRPSLHVLGLDEFGHDYSIETNNEKIAKVTINWVTSICIDLINQASELPITLHMQLETCMESRHDQKGFEVSIAETGYINPQNIKTHVAIFESHFRNALSKYFQLAAVKKFTTPKIYGIGLSRLIAAAALTAVARTTTISSELHLVKLLPEQNETTPDFEKCIFQFYSYLCGDTVLHLPVTKDCMRKAIFGMSKFLQDSFIKFGTGVGDTKDNFAQSKNVLFYLDMKRHDREWQLKAANMRYQVPKRFITNESLARTLEDNLIGFNRNDSLDFLNYLFPNIKTSLTSKVTIFQTINAQRACVNRGRKLAMSLIKPLLQKNYLLTHNLALELGAIDNPELANIII